METFLSRAREIANAAFTTNGSAQLTESPSLPTHEQALPEMCPADFALFLQKENVSNIDNGVEENNDEDDDDVSSVNRHRSFVYQLIDAYNDTNGISDENSKSINMYQQFVLKALALCLHSLSRLQWEQQCARQATDKITDNHEKRRYEVNMTNEDDIGVNANDMELFSSEDALMVALFVSELMTVDDKFQFWYLCECISSLHCMYLHFKYMFDTKINANTFDHVNESHRNNKNNNDEDDENIESLSAELHALQTALTGKCNHHSVIVQLSATKTLCSMFMQSMHVASYLGNAVGVDVSSRLSDEIASLTTQTFSPLANATLNMTMTEERTSINHAKNNNTNNNNYNDDNTLVVDEDNSNAHKEQSASATLVTVIECVEQVLLTSIISERTAESQTLQSEHTLLESSIESASRWNNDIDTETDDIASKQKNHYLQEGQLQNQKQHSIYAANVEYVLQKLLRILQSYLSAQQSRVALTDNTDNVKVDHSHMSLMQTSNSNSKRNAQNSNVSSNALQMFAVKHVIRRMLSIALHLSDSDNTNTIKGEINMSINTLMLSLQLREALSAALNAFCGTLPCEEIAVITRLNKSNLFCIYNNSRDHIKSMNDDHTSNRGNINTTTRTLEMSEVQSWYVTSSNSNMEEAAEGNKRVWPISDDTLTSVNCDAVLAKLHKLHKLRQHRSTMRYDKNNNEQNNGNSDDDDDDEEEMDEEEEGEENKRHNAKEFNKYNENETNMNSEDESIDADDDDDDAMQTTIKDGQGNVNDNTDNINNEAKGGLLIIEESDEAATFTNATTDNDDESGNIKKSKTVIRTTLDFNVTPTLLVEMVLMSLSQLPLLSESEIHERHLQGLTLMQYNAASLAQQEEVKRIIAMERAGVEAIPASQLLWQVNESAKLHQESLTKLRRHEVQAALLLAAFRSVLSSYVYMREEREAVVRSTQTLIARCLLHLPVSVVDMAMDEMLLMFYNEVVLASPHKEIQSQYESTHTQGNLETTPYTSASTSASATGTNAAKTRNEWVYLQGRVCSWYNCAIQVLFVLYAAQAPVHDRILHSLFDMSESNNNNVLMTTSPQMNMINMNANNLQISQVKQQLHSTKSNNDPDTFTHQTIQQDNLGYNTSTPTSFLSHLRNQNELPQQEQEQQQPQEEENTAMLNIDEPVAFLRDNDVHIAAHELGRKRPRDHHVSDTTSIATLHNTSSSSHSSSLPSLHSSFTFINDTMYNVSLYSSFLCRVIEVMQSAKCTTLLLDVLLQAPSLTRSVWYYLYKEFCLNAQNKTRIVLGIWILTHIARRRAPYKECAIQLLLQLATSANEYARRLAIKQIGALLPQNQEELTSFAVQSSTASVNTNLQSRIKLNDCITAAEEMQIMQFAQRQLTLIPTYYLTSTATLKTHTKQEFKNEEEEQKEEEANDAAAKQEEATVGGDSTHNTIKEGIENNAALRKEVKRLEFALNRHLGLFLMLCYRHPASLFASLLNVYKECIDQHNDAMAHLLTRNADVIKLIQHLLHSQPTVFLSTVMPLLRRYGNSSPLLVQSFLNVISAQVEEMAVAASSSSSSSAQNEQEEHQHQQGQKEDKHIIKEQEKLLQTAKNKNAMINARQIAMAILAHAKAMYESSIIPLDNDNNSDDDDDDEEENINVSNKNSNNYNEDKSLHTHNNKRLRSDSNQLYINSNIVGNKNTNAKIKSQYNKWKSEFALHDIRFIAPFLSYVASQDVKLTYLRSFMYFVQLQLERQRETQIKLQNNSRENEEYEMNVYTCTTKERLHSLSSVSELNMFIGNVIRQLVVKSPVIFDDGVARGISRVELFVLLHRITQELTTNQNETLHKHDTNNNNTNNDATMTASSHSILGAPPSIPTSTSETSQVTSSIMTTNSILPLRNIENINNNNISNNNLNNNNIREYDGILGNAEPLLSHTSDYMQSSSLYSNNTSNNLYEREQEQHLEQLPERQGFQNDQQKGRNTTDVLLPISVVTTKKVIEVCLLLHRNFDNMNELLNINSNNEAAERLYGVEEVQKAVLKMMHITPLPPSQLMSTILLSVASFRNNALLAPQVSNFIQFVIHNVLLPLQHVQIWSKSARLWKGVLLFIEHYYRECSSLLVELPDSVLITALHEQPLLAQYFREEHGNNASFSHILASV